jgi:hypothetical protein
VSKAAVLQAAEQVLEGTIGSVRTVAANTVRAGAFAGISDEKLAADVLVKTRYEVEAVEDETTGIVAPETADLSIDRVTVRVRLVFSPSTTGELDDVARRTTRAACLTTADACRDALAFPGNLRQTQAGVATNLAGHALLRKGPVRVAREDWEKRLFVAEFLMTGLVHRTRAVA